MKISCNLLKKHIKKSDSIDFLKIWDIFTIRTAEVERIELKGEDLKDVVVGEILECENHPTKDNYHILKVDNGQKIVDILCGAPNVRKGLKVAIVKPGGMVSGFTIEPKKIAGVLSEGMLCSEKELGIGDNHDEILELEENLIVGKDICEYLPIKDIVVEIDNKSLTHRPDLWGHYGIAREIAAITNCELLPLSLFEEASGKEKLDITIKDSKLCLRYIGIKIENIANNKTPIEMKTILHYVGMRSISLLVDLTNYVMIELGQPMHAFDARKVKSIEIGLANNNDRFITLDGKERILTDKDLMIKKNDEYFGIAGVMGGLDSEILPDTSTIILESANFEAFTIRKTAIRLGLRTEASSRYEKTLDPNLAELAAKRFIYLLKEIDSDIVIASKLTDIYPDKKSELKIKLTKTKLNKNINNNLSDQEIISILTNLGFDVKNLKEYFEVKVPTWRSSKDVTIEEDLIEEIARMYGYENFNKEPMNLKMDFTENKTTYEEYYNLKRYLATKYNMHEVHSYLWYKTSFLNKIGIVKDNVRLFGKNEDNVLRDDMGLSLIEIATNNLKNYEDVKVFELGTIIKNNTNCERLTFVIGSSAETIINDYELGKKVISNLILTFKNLKVEFKITEEIADYYKKGMAAVVNDKIIGAIKILDNVYTSKLIKKKILIVGEIYLEDFNRLDKIINLYEEVSRFPMVALDYTIIDTLGCKYMMLKDIVDGFKSPLINNYKFIDKYVAANESRYTIRFNLVSYDKTLEEAEINDFKEQFIKYIEDNKLKIVQ